MPVLERFTTAEASADRMEQIRRLLTAAFGDELTDDDWNHALGGSHFVVVDDQAVLAHAAVVERLIEVSGRRLRTGYVEAMASDPARRRQGLGTTIMREATGMIRAELEMGALSTSLHGYYSRLGWERWQGPSYVRRGSRLVRTPEEDDGIMVLRFGPSQGVDLAAGIACQARSGDDW